MGNTLDLTELNSEASSERLIYRSWRDSQQDVFARKHAPSATSSLGKSKRSLSTGNLADHAIFPPGDTSLDDPQLNSDAGPDEVVDIELAAFRKLCHDVTAHLIGPQFVSTSALSAPSSPSPPPPQHALSSSMQAPTAPELLPTPPPPKLVVNHLYNPVLQKVKEHLGGLPEWYTVKTSPAEAANHIRLLVEARKYEAGRVAVSVSPLLEDGHPVPSMYIIVVCARDRRQLLDAITRCVSTRASIMEATIITTRDGFALDRFVMKREEESVDEADADNDVTFWASSLKRDIEEVINCLPPSPQLASVRKRTSRVPRPLSASPKPTWEVPFQEIRLIRVLGQGRSGRTFLAEWRGERVAAKVFSLGESEAGSSSLRLEQFQGELALVSRLDHPNVVKFVGASARPPRYIILFELCEGDVLQVVRNSKKKPFSFFQIALGAANGLAYLHRNHIIHRDVKPENLMLDKLGRVKVVDFGLSIFANDDSRAASERTAETGTYRYMAPEVMMHEAYSYPADVYSFGMVMWVLLSRKVPFEESTPLQAAMAVSRSGARPRFAASVPAALQTLVKQCWDKDPSVRPAFDSIIAALRDIQQGLSKKDKTTLDPEGC